MVDLTTSYAGLTLNNPLVVSASPLCKEIANLRRMEDAGAAAIILHSLFEEQINIESNELDKYLWQSADVSAEAVNYCPNLENFNIGPDAYLEHIRKAKEAVSVPIFGSLNGVSEGGWIRYAQLMEEAGADGIELNIYFLATDGQEDSAAVEAQYVHLVQAVRARLKVPLTVKIGPYFSSITNLAQRLDAAGADSLVIFNRFYQPDFDLSTLEVVPGLQLSTSHELTLRLHWAAVLFGRIKSDIAITGGVHSSEDVIKSMLAGARVVMTTSALIERGIGLLRSMLTGVEDWLERNEYQSIRQIQGSMSQQNVANPAAFSRANYMKVLSTYSLEDSSALRTR
jgi:dihydroorotate dehydrogenase (fumarate)